MQTKSEQYFPFEVSIFNNESISELINEHGPKGFGAYVMILAELRLSKDYTCGMNTIHVIARKCKISLKLVESVLHDFDLFILTRDEDTLMISSPYMCRVMEAYDNKIQKCAEGGRKSADKNKRGANGQFTSTAGTSDQIRLDNNNKTTTNVVSKESITGSNSSSNDHNWKKYLDDAIRDEEWMAVLAMNSGINSIFVKYQDYLVECFCNHIRLQGTESNIQSAKDAKSYFANYLRPGTPTHRRIVTHLINHETEQRRYPERRFETLDPKTGKRSYCGRPIPNDAPLRPNNTAVWDEKESRWL